MKYEEKKDMLLKEMEQLSGHIDNQLIQLLMKVYDLGRRDAFEEMDGIAKAINQLKASEDDRS